MKTISTELQTHLDGEVSTTCCCWSLTRTDSTVIYATDHDQDIVYDGNTYKALDYPFSGTAIQSSADLAVDNLDLDVILASIDRDDLLAGLYDYAEIKLFLVNWSDLAQGILKLRRGWLGEITVEDGKLKAEVRGLMQSMQQTVGEIYTASCPCELGDTRCGVSLGGYTSTGTVTSATASPYDSFIDSSRTEADDYWNGGTLTWTSGENNGYSMEVQDYASATDTVILFEPMPYPIAAGDTYSIVVGCDKSLATCRDTFDNVANFRGFPHVPGQDVINQTPDYREP